MSGGGWDLLAAGVCARGKHDIRSEADTLLMGGALRVCRGCAADMADERRAVRTTPDEGARPPAPAPAAPHAGPSIAGQRRELRDHIVELHRLGLTVKQVGQTLGVTNALVRGVIKRYG